MSTPARRASTLVRRASTLVRRAATLVRRHAKHPWWRIRDYAYVLRWQVEGLLRRGGAEVYLSGSGALPPVVLLPGVYESWQFLRPLADLLHRRGHRVHVLPGVLGYNLRPVPESAARVSRYLQTHDLHDVVVVAHSKGGLIGKQVMLADRPSATAGRIRSMVAVNTPFAGSVYARWVPLPGLRAFVPTDLTLVALAAESEVNTRIVSVFSHWDPHIPAGSRLDGARNVELATPGHFRPLADPELERVLLDVMRTADAADHGVAYGEPDEGSTSPHRPGQYGATGASGGGLPHGR